MLPIEEDGLGEEGRTTTFSGTTTWSLTNGKGFSDSRPGMAGTSCFSSAATSARMLSPMVRSDMVRSTGGLVDGDMARRGEVEGTVLGLPLRLRSGKLSTRSVCC